MLKGIDISKWQNTSAVDLAEDFVIIKATEGVGYVDPTCDIKYQYAKRKNKLLGVYHFARPNLNGAVAEADYFIKNTTGYWKNRDAILVLDWEAGNTRNVAWAKAWLDRVYAKTGVRPLIYMSASVIRSANWSSVAKANYGLWVAGYPSRYNVKNPPVPTEGEMPYNTSPWTFAAIWQYTSSAGTLDRDVAYMTKEAWGKYAGKVAKPKPVITTKDITEATPIPFEVIRRPEADKLEGWESETQSGTDGQRVVVTRVTYTDGKETDRKVISDKTTKPVSQVIFYGTKEPEDTTPEPPKDETPQQPPEIDTPNEPKPSEGTNTHVNGLRAFLVSILNWIMARKEQIITWVVRVVKDVWKAKK